MSILSVLGGLAANYFIPGSGLLGFAGGAAAAKGLEGLLFDDDDVDPMDAKKAKWNAGPAQQEGWDKNLYKSRYTGPDGEAPAFSTAEERDAYDKNLLSQSSQAAQVDPIYQGLAQGGLAQFAAGGLIQGPGTVTSDSIPGQIMQNGRPVEQIAVGNGEVILSGKDLARMDPDGDMKRAGMRLGGAANGTRGAEAARMFAEVSEMKGRYNG
tara:strand:+ start:2398 stop:3030 length:633 start_codon:yes stop_codon:yes gene_type:complete